MKSLSEVKINNKKDFIVNGIMKSNGLYCLIALPKVGKSMLALQLSDSISNNKQFLGFDINPSPVLYISTENEGNQLKQRTKLMNIELDDNKFKFIDRSEYSSFSLRDMEIDLRDFAQDLGGKLVIIDMLKDIQFDFAYDINNYQDIGQKVLPKLRELCNKYDFSILFIHHLNKKGRSLGSTALDGSVDGILRLKQSQSDKNRFTLSVDNRDYQSVDISLIRDDNCILNVCDEETEEILDYNLINFIKYVAAKIDVEFTCNEIVNKANINLTPKQFGRLLNSNLPYLEKEGIYITKKRNSKQRLYNAHYEETIDENN